MKYQRKIDGKARGFQVNTKQRETNEQQEGKECKTRRQEVEKLRIQKTIECKNIYVTGVEDS
jgi:hypothetical protein